MRSDESERAADLEDLAGVGGHECQIFDILQSFNVPLLQLSCLMNESKDKG